jgi:hypothetical protein
MVSAGVARYKSRRHFVRFGRYEKIDRFAVLPKRRSEVNSAGSTPDILGCDHTNPPQIG